MWNGASCSSWPACCRRPRYCPGPPSGCRLGCLVRVRLTRACLTLWPQSAAGDRDAYLLHAQAAAATWDAPGGGESREGFFSPGGWFSDVDGEWFQDCALRGLAHLTDPAAEPALRAALHQPGHPRREATLLETLAVCLARRAEPEQAAAAALGSLVAAQGLPLWVDRVREVRADLEPWADLPAVRELDDALVSA